MKFNVLGNTGLSLSAIGFGTWGIGGSGYFLSWGEQNDHDSISAIRGAFDIGINWIDTSPIYGLGHSEKLIAKVIKGFREQIIISSKCGFRWDETKKIFSNLKKESIRLEVEESLKRLETDVIDLYQIHRPTPEEDIEGAWDTLNDLIKEGKIRFAGVSTFSLEQLKRVHAMHPVSFIQPPYSIVQYEIEENGILDFCKANRIGVIAYSPVYSGLLSGKLSKEKIENFSPADIRRQLEYFKEPFLTPVLEMLDEVRLVVERNNKTIPQMVIAWVLRRPEVTSAIVGARKPLQIEQNLPAVDWVFPDADRVELDEIIKRFHIRLKGLKT